MATPSSSATTPSPQLHYLQASAPLSTQPMDPDTDSQSADDERQRAIQKFMARAELSKLTRGLRARLSYATYKATHNLTHTTLNDLEQQAEKLVAVAHASSSKAGNNYYNNPATQGNSAMTPSASSRTSGRKGSMAPPPTVTASAGKSLYTSILAPPPAKRARTIHNPQDPPIPAPPKPKATVARKGGKSTRSTPSTSGRQKSRKDEKGKGRDIGDRSSGHRLTPRSSFGEDTNNEVDMKAAATLTSLLLSRPALSASSPRSSMSAGSDVGSLHSYSQFVQSSARTTTAPTSVVPSQESPFAAPYARSSTPPPLSKRTQSLTQASDMRFHSHSRSVPNARVTPKTQSQPVLGSNGRAHPSTHSPHPPTDTEAADLMLFLATSPSPVRPTTAKERDARDMAAFRSLSGNPALQGRVLFPGSGSGGVDHLHTSQNRGKPLQRDGSGFSSTLSIATDASGETVYAGGSAQQKSIGAPITAASSIGATSPLKLATSSAGNSRHTSVDVPQMPTITPPTPTEQVPQDSSLPVMPPHSPRPSSRVSNTGSSQDSISPQSVASIQYGHRTATYGAISSSSSSSPTSVPSYPNHAVSGNAATPSIPTAPPTPSSSVPFNLHDFLNVSPSPAAPTPQKTASSGSLRADVGRRLFEEHHTSMGHMSHGTHSHGQTGNGSGLGAGIDLVKS